MSVCQLAQGPLPRLGEPAHVLFSLRDLLVSCTWGTTVDSVTVGVTVTITSTVTVIGSAIEQLSNPQGSQRLMRATISMPGVTISKTDTHAHQALHVCAPPLGNLIRLVLSVFNVICACRDWQDQHCASAGRACQPAACVCSAGEFSQQVVRRI